MTPPLRKAWLLPGLRPSTWTACHFFGRPPTKSRHPVRRLPIVRKPSPRDVLPVSPALAGRADLRWVDPIVPVPQPQTGGGGVVINIGGVHSHLFEAESPAYETLVLPAAVAAIARSQIPLLAVCGSVGEAMIRDLRETVGPEVPIGPQTAYAFEALLKRAYLLISSPGSTTLLHAMAIRLPTVLLPPQNLSQILNGQLDGPPGRRSVGQQKFFHLQKSRPFARRARRRRCAIFIEHSIGLRRIHTSARPAWPRSRRRSILCQWRASCVPWWQSSADVEPLKWLRSYRKPASYLTRRSIYS
jgi:hypothetical protein